MMIRRRLTRLTRMVGLLMLVLMPLSAVAQGQREVDLIAELGQEEIAQRAVAAAAAVEAEHQALLEEQSRLRTVYQQYLGAARRTAQQAIETKRRAVTGEQVDALRRQARIVIDEVTDATKKRVRDELDPIYDQLEAMICITRDDLLTVNPELAALRKRLAPGNGSDLDWVDDIAILYALCPDKAQAEIIGSNLSARESISDDEAQSIDLCNRRRLVLGLNALAIDMKLVECGRDHSSDMIAHNFFAHNSPVEGKTTPWDRAKNFGTSASGENIAAGYHSGRAVTIGWWYSPGHLKNMMGRGHKRIGVGQENQHYTQMFGR